MSNITHLIFDTETLGLKERAVVCSLSCVPFTFEDRRPYSEIVKGGFFVKFDVKEQIGTYGRTLTPSTVEWWKTQDAAAKKYSITPSEDDVSMEDGLRSMLQFIKDSAHSAKKSYVLSRGNAFDFPKIEDMLDQIGETCPYAFYRVRDTRSIIDVMAGVDNGKYMPLGGAPKGFIAHHALHDAALDAWALQDLYHLSTVNDDIPF